MRIENYKLIVYTSIFVLGYLAITTNHAFAEITANDNWTIEIKDVNITSNKAGSNQKKQPTSDQPSPDTYSGKNYKIKFGFENLPPLAPLSLNISNNLIDYGPLSATNQVYRTSNLSISNSGTKGFIVKGYENHPLSTTGSNSSIPDTTCDNGSCSEVTSALWTNTLTYGFGYRCDNVNNNNCPVDFNLENYYKQFADISKNEAEQIIISGNLSSSNHESQITYKVNISKTQPSDSYTNEITYLAIPNY